MRHPAPIAVSRRRHQSSTEPEPETHPMLRYLSLRGFRALVTIFLVLTLSLGLGLPLPPPVPLLLPLPLP